MLQLPANIETSLIVLQGFTTRHCVIKQEWDEDGRCHGVSLTGGRKRAGVALWSLGMNQSCRTPAAFLRQALSALLCAMLLCSAWHTHLGFRFEYTPSIKMSRVFLQWLRWDRWLVDSLSAIRASLTTWGHSDVHILVSLCKKRINYASFLSFGIMQARIPHWLFLGRRVKCLYNHNGSFIRIRQHLFIKKKVLH